MADFPPEKNRPAVYLAGGFRSGWQDQVIRRLSKQFKIFDPRAHGLEHVHEFTKWDLDAIRESDYVLAFMEASNPGGFALALEAGFAHALRKEIILVNTIDSERRKYFAMVEAVSTHVLPSLGAAIDYLLVAGTRSTST